MIVDLIRWAVDRQTNHTSGLNAQLGAVPRDAGEPPPDPATIYNEIEHDWVARGGLSRDVLLDEDKNPVPVVLIRMLRSEQGMSVQPLPEYDQNDPSILPVEIVFARRKIESPTSTITVASQIRDARQTIRTAMRVFAQQFDSSHSAVVRNGVTITLPPNGFLLNSLMPEPVDDLVIDTLVAPFRIRDPWALGL
jgi:hypothetical protein